MAGGAMGRTPMIAIFGKLLKFGGQGTIKAARKNGPLAEGGARGHSLLLIKDW